MRQRIAERIKKIIMKKIIMKKITGLLVLIFIMLFYQSFSQSIDSANILKTDTIISKKSLITDSLKTNNNKKEFYIKGAVTITNKGISYIPNLSLGKPAILFDLSLGNKKLSFEPQLRFSLTGEPWAFLFPVRYKINPAGKFQLSAGINPLMNFKTVTYTVSGVTTTDLVNRRYLGGELKPSYFFTKNTSVGVTYLYFCGVSDRAVRTTNFVSFNINFSNIKFGQKFYAKFNPQVYYLYQDGKEGYYFNSVITLLRRNFPLSIQTNMNAAIETTIPGSEKFIWNASLIYTLNRTYIRK